ncbi:MAG TPA: hypothetical protein VJG49_03080 [Candidatus Nanoarchaeia archaeon]|nr:hypothetical protein [Candidatus Nanoarchaeia archaeon]
MAWYEKRWWKRLLKKEPEPKEDSIKDLTVIVEYLEDINDEAKLLLPELKKLEELETERQVASSGLAQVNLEAQAVILDKILKEYGFFQNDVDINGIRIRQVAKEFLKQAKKAGLKDLVKEKEKDNNWKFNW